MTGLKTCKKCGLTQRAANKKCSRCNKAFGPQRPTNKEN